MGASAMLLQPTTTVRWLLGRGRNALGALPLSCLALLTLGGAACGSRTAPADAPDTPQMPREPVAASAAVDRAVATTGDMITYKIVVEHDEALQVQVPEPGAQIAGLRIVDSGREPLQHRNGRIIDTRWYALRADLVGSYVLPAVQVAYWPEETAPQATAAPDDTRTDDAKTDDAKTDDAKTGDAKTGDAKTDDAKTADAKTADAKTADAKPKTIATSEIFIEVESVLPSDAQASDIRDIKPLRRVAPTTPWIWILSGAGALLPLLAGGYWFWWRRRRRQTELPHVPPHEVAFAALEALRSTDFADALAVRRYYFAISGVVRCYVEAGFALNATDLTTEEIVVLLPKSSVDREQRHHLAAFLRETDRVKFAGHLPTEAEIEHTYERALSFVEATIPTPAPDDPTTHARSGSASAVHDEGVAA